MLTDWTHASAPALAAFLASLVEFVEALTVVLAVGAVRGWRGALGGAGLALVVLTALVNALGPALQHVPLDLAKLVIGALLALFGLRWLRKAMLRAAGVIPLHDEQAAYEGKTRALRGLGSVDRGWDRLAIATSLKITMIEGLEVVFIVIATGAGSPSSLLWASIGALIALVLVVAAGVALHRPITALPENTLKLGVGVLLTAFGTFWVGEGSGLAWPGADWSIPALAVGLLATALVGVHTLRPRASSPGMSITP
jgi:uncharacterized membrane protein